MVLYLPPVSSGALHNKEYVLDKLLYYTPAFDAQFCGGHEFIRFVVLMEKSVKGKQKTKLPLCSSGSFLGRECRASSNHGLGSILICKIQEELG
jgi:hypothetical protein